MNHGSSDRIPVSSLILFASIVFTLITYFTFKALWGVDIHLLWLLVVLGFQLAVLLLGGSKVLTRLGAAALSALIAVGACIGALFFFFPPILELRIAGAVGGGAALVFIIASFVAASRADPVPSSAAEPLVMGKVENDHTAVLIKYGAIQEHDPVDTIDPPLAEAPPEERVVVRQEDDTRAEPPPIEKELVYEFDELSESRMGLSLGVEESDHEPVPLNVVDENLKLETGDLLPPEYTEEPPMMDAPKTPSNGAATGENGVEAAPAAWNGFTSPSEPDPEDEPAIPDNWVEETARYMAFETMGETTDNIPENTPGDVDTTGPAGREPLSETPLSTRAVPGFGMRTRYKVLDAVSGEHYGTYYGDEGYSTLDLVSLTGLLGPEPGIGELRIVKLDWSNFDEVEVHVGVDAVVPMELEVEAVTGSEAGLPAEEPEPEPEKEEVRPVVSPPGPRYMIYDRRTIQPMGEYFPEGSLSRIDRLTLYKMFPEYDFKTFEIDSIRWEADEVRILIRGEKKGAKTRT